MTRLEQSNSSDRSFVIRGARVWDGVSDRVDSRLQDIRIRLGRIVSIGDDRDTDPEAEIWNAPRGATALPGLIDAHVHLTLDPTVGSLPDQLSIPEATVVAGAEVRAVSTTLRQPADERRQQRGLERDHGMNCGSGLFSIVVPWGGSLMPSRSEAVVSW